VATAAGFETAPLTRTSPGFDGGVASGVYPGGVQPVLLLLCGSCWSARPIVMLKRFPTSRAVVLSLGTASRGAVSGTPFSVTDRIAGLFLISGPATVADDCPEPSRLDA
jgi:hypothetical protein